MSDNSSEKEQNFFKALSEIKTPRPLLLIPKISLIALLIMILFCAIIPWQQTSRGFGTIIAADPNNRSQNIHAPVAGRINKWFVRDGDRVKEGDKIVEISDNDPLIIERLQSERDARKRKFNVATIASETSQLNYSRQEELFKKGLTSRKNFEEAKIEYKKLLSNKESAAAELAESETKLARQERQLILAPKDGVILKVLAGNNSTLVKAGDKIAAFAPDLLDAAVELYINGNDAPLIYVGRKVRLQFEGWPAVQFSGWPAVAIGTFGGVVSAVDSSISENGKLRIIVTKDKNENWPSQQFLRHGAKAYGWVLLDNVKIGYEIWRQINGFPANFNEQINANYYQ